MRSISLSLLSLLACLSACESEQHFEDMSPDAGPSVGGSGGGNGAFHDPDASLHNPDANLHNPEPHTPAPDSGVMLPPNDIVWCADFTTDDRLDPALPCRGPIAWQKRITNGEPQSSYVEVATDTHGNIYWLMNIFGHLDLGGQEIGSPVGETALVISYTRDGTLRWLFQHTDSRAGALALSTDQACVALSGNGVQVDLPASLDSDGSFGLEAVVCMTLDGVPRWSRTIDSGITGISGLTFDARGDLYVAGSYQQTLVISQALSAPSYDATEPGPKGDAFVVSYAADGTPRWLTTMGGPENDAATSVAVHADGSVVLVGTDEGGMRAGDRALELTPPEEHRSLEHGFIAMLDAQGALLWAKRTPDDETFGPDRVLIDGRGRALVTFMFGWKAFAYDQAGQVESSYEDVPSLGRPIVAYDDGFVVVRDCESWSSDSFTCVVDTDLDFNPRSSRALARYGAPENRSSGFDAVSRMTDGSVVIASDWADEVAQYLVVLEPVSP